MNKIISKKRTAKLRKFATRSDKRAKRRQRGKVWVKKSSKLSSQS